MAVDFKLLSFVGCGNRKLHKKNENIQFIQNSTFEIVFNCVFSCFADFSVWVDLQQMHSGFTQRTTVGTELLTAFQLLCF